MGFEAMPQIADPEIAATWDEIELEAALRGGGAEVQLASAEGAAASVSEALRAVEELQRLPKGERKRRAEELLRTLTSTLPALAPEQEAGPDTSEPMPAAEPPAIEPAAELPEFSEPAAQELPATELPEGLPEFAEPVAQEPPAAEPVSELPEIAEPVAQELPGIEPAAQASPVISESLTEDLPSAETAACTSPEIAEPQAEDLPSTEAAMPEIAELAFHEPCPERGAAEAAEEAPVPCPSVPMAEAAAVEDGSVESAINAGVAEGTVEIAPAPLLPAAASEPYSIPKFLTTECPSLEPEHADSLIPFRSAVAACTVIGAVLLIYFGSSHQLGVAAHPNLAASEPVETRLTPQDLPLSVAVRQAFVAEAPAYSPASEPLRSYRPPFVGFDFLDDAAPHPPAAAKAEPQPEPPVLQAASPTVAQAPPEPPAPEAAPPTVSQAEGVPDARVVPQAPTEESAALLLPVPDADLTALIRRGDALLKAGDIVAARSAYQRAAAGGSAKAEIGVGKTYDPLVLAELGARGVRGNAVEAASWYARAGEAGDEEGQQRLHALISGLSDCMLAAGACGHRKP